MAASREEVDSLVRDKMNQETWIVIGPYYSKEQFDFAVSKLEPHEQRNVFYSTDGERHYGSFTSDFRWRTSYDD